MKTSRKATRATARGGRALLVLGGVVLALLIGEIGARLLVAAPPAPRLTEPADSSAFEQTEEGLYVYKPGASFSHVYDVAADPRGYYGAEGRVDYRINGLGHRGAGISIEKPPGVRRILCLGDSFTFGEGVREEDTWPRRLERLAGPRTQVINAGVQGYDLYHEALYLDRYGQFLQPDVVVIGFFMNDAMPFGETVTHHQLLTQAPVESSRLGRISRLWSVLERKRSAARRSRQYIDDLRASFTSRQWKEINTLIPALRTMANQEGFDIVAMIFPLLHELNGNYPLEREHGEVRKAFEEAGIEVIDLLDSYRGYRATELQAHPVDPHPNELAHTIAARRLAHWLRSKGR